MAIACGDNAVSPETPTGSSTTAVGTSGEGPEPVEPTDDDPGRVTQPVSGSTHADTTGPTEASTSTGETVEPPIVEPSFIDVAVDVGLDHVHGKWNTAPNCLIDQIGPGTGGFCLPERMTAGAAAADYDLDGFVDLIVTRSHGRPLLYRNAGDGSFTEEGLNAGIGDYAWGTTGVAWADLDNDGDQDLYVSTIGDTRYYLFINDGTGHFTEEAIARGASLKSEHVHAGMSVAVGDYDLDGFTDVYVGEWRTIAGLGKMSSHSRLLHNLGPAAPGHFEDVTVAAGVVVDDVWKDVTPAGRDLLVLPFIRRPRWRRLARAGNRERLSL